MDGIHDSSAFQMLIPPAPILHRKALVQALVKAIEYRNATQFSSYKLLLLCAPAGYGKTTLLIDVANQLSSTCCWHMLQADDADPLLFLRRLSTTMQRCFPTFGRQVASLFDTDGADGKRHPHSMPDPAKIMDALLDAFKNDMPQPFILLLCNYHEINQNASINQWLDRLLATIPRHGMIIIESQAMPNLVLAPLIACRQMLGIGEHELQFTPQEVYDLAALRGVTPFTLPEAEQLTSGFKGWIAGILLGSRLGYAHFPHSTPQDAEDWQQSPYLDNNKQLLAYIQHHVFKHETATYEFLKETSLLLRLRPDLCDALLETHDAASRLAYAEQRGLFIVRDRANEDAQLAKDYICHPALREILENSLHQQEPERYHMLHRRAARFLQAERQYEQALRHADQAQDYELLTSIILEIAPSPLYEEQGEQLLCWLETLPQEMFNQDPQLLLVAANIHLRQGNFSLVPPLLEGAETLLKQMAEKQNQPMLLFLQAKLLISRGHLLFFHGDFQLTRELCQQALALLPSDEQKLSIRAYQFLGVSLIVGAGKVQEGITQLQQALQLSRAQQNEQQIATLHRLIANAYGWLANHALAEYHQTRAFAIWKKLGKSQGIIYSLSSMGLLKMRQGFAQQAEEMLRQALHEARDIYHFKSGEAYALVALGELHNSLGQYVQALHYLEDGLILARDCEDRYLTCCVLCNLTIAYLFLGDTPTAQFFLNQVFLKDGETNSFECLLFHLTQGTVYLAQQDYEQAEAALQYTVDAASQANIQIIYVSALLRLTACYLRKNKQHDALQTARYIVKLNKKGDFDFFFKTELRNYVELSSSFEQISRLDVQEDVLDLIQESPSASEGPSSVLQDVQEAHSVQVVAFGDAKVTINGMPITRWRMARAMELFFFLLANGRPVRKSQIVDALWSNQDRDQIDSNVRTTIYYLRKALGSALVIFQAGLYSLNLGDKVWYDVEIFNEQYKQARRAIDAKDDKEAEAAFTRMVKLYEGDYLQVFYNDWCIFQRDKLRRAFMDAHHQLAQIAWRQNNWDASLHHWQQILLIDPCDEIAHYNSMRCYLQQGKRELALRQFQRCSLNLQEELNTVPSATLQQLYQSILM